MPLTSISKVTSIWGTPIGAGGIPVRLNCPKEILSRAIARSPWRTWIVTTVCMSLAVLKIWLCVTGIVVFLSMIRVITSPFVSTPNDRGVTSRRRRSLTSPVITPAWIAAPRATASMGSTPRSAFFPMNFSTYWRTIGMRVGPPIKIILSISFGRNFASLIAVRIGPSQRSIISRIKSSNFARVNFRCRCFGPDLSAVR